LPFFGVQQNSAAPAARVVHGMVTGHEHRRRGDRVTDCRRGDELEAYLLRRHAWLPFYRREHKTLSHQRLGTGPLSVMIHYGRFSNE
jgi:hypothetical protein